MTSDGVTCTIFNSQKATGTLVGITKFRSGTGRLFFCKSVFFSDVCSLTVFHSIVPSSQEGDVFACRAA